MSDLVLVALVAAGTLLMRSSLVARLAGARIPPSVERAFRLVAPAVLAGLVAQTLLVGEDGVRVDPSWDLAAARALGVARKTRSVTWKLVAGMGFVWLLEAIFSPVRRTGR